MELKTIFELPIYTMSQIEFEKRWNKKKEKEIKQYIDSGLEPEKAKRLIKEQYLLKSKWKYNQIIGYIKISVGTQEVKFDYACSQDKKYFIDSKTKHFIEDLSPSGWSIHIKDNDTDSEIKEEIQNYLRSIERENFKKRFLDDEQFNNLISYTNIKAMF